jgi:hypothetical protein
MMTSVTEMTKPNQSTKSRNWSGPRRQHGFGLRPRFDDERGSSLILALVYIIAISLIVGALADWAMNDLTNTKHFQNASSLDSAISGAAEVAIQSVRYYPYMNSTNTNTNGTANFGTCWNPPSNTYVSDVPFSADNNALVAVWCSTLENLQSPNTRKVTFIACTVTAAVAGNSGSSGTALNSCKSNPTLQAAVTFDDYPSGGGGLLTQTCTGGQGVCGFAATTTQWTWAP